MFYVGQKVVCINPLGWYDEDTLLEVDGPKKDEIVTIEGFDKNGSLILPKYSQDDGYDPTEFRPLEEYRDSMSIAMQLVQEIDQTDKAKNPIKEYGYTNRTR